MSMSREVDSLDPQDEQSTAEAHFISQSHLGKGRQAYSLGVACTSDEVEPFGREDVRETHEVDIAAIRKPRNPDRILDRPSLPTGALE